MHINSLPLPNQLVQLIENGKWKHPGDEVLRTLIPDFYAPIFDPVDFLTSFEAIKRNSKIPLGGEMMMDTYKEGLGSKSNVPDLPWVDAELRLFIAVCGVPGADVGIALDYRASSSDPRVVALVYGGDNNGFSWTLVKNSFSEFVDQCGFNAG